MESLNHIINVIKDKAKDIKLPSFNSKTLDFNTVEGIAKIPLKNLQPLRGVESPVNEIEYILQRKATEHKRNGRMDLAIACLKRSNELMDLTKGFKYTEKDYLRYIKYLRRDGQNSLADIEEEKIYQKHPEFKDKRISNLKGLNTQIDKLKRWNKDILIIDSNKTCPVCSQFNKKKYSVSGRSKIYPKLPIEFLRDGGFCKNCIIAYYIDFTELNN